MNSPDHRPPAPRAPAADATPELLRLLPDALLVVDRAGVICGLNEPACRLTGLARGAVLGRPLTLFDPPEPAAGLAAFAAALPPGEGKAGASRLPAAGEWRDCAISAFRAPEPDGRAYLIIRDETAARRQAAAQAERAARADELAHAAEAANRAKSAFLASMSHELRTPLNVINGLAATMAEQSRDGAEVHSAQLILESGQNLLALVEELIDFSGLQAGKSRLEPRPFNLLGLVTQVVRQAGTLARRKGLLLTFRVRTQVPASVVGDPRRLQQVLLNLLGNAVAYTPEGGLHLDVGACRTATGWRLSFTVADSGIGIAPADLAKLFHPFARAEFGPARQVHGTGLGLAIARSFAQLMGGDIKVRSRVGKGSVFRCTVETDVSDGGGALASLRPTSAAGRRALVVVSDKPTRRMLADLLRHWDAVPVLWPGPDRPMAAADLEAGVDFAIVEAALARGQGALLNRFLQTAAPNGAVPVVWLSSPDRQWPVPPTAQAANVPLPLDLAVLARAAAGLLNPNLARSIAPLPPLGQRVPLRILVADDIPTNREMLRRMLQHLGYNAQLVTNGAEAVAALDLQPFDLLVLDVEMPVMNGLAAAREIVRRNPDVARRPKLVALTANAQSGDRERCLAAGMDDYLSKPVLPAHLEAAVLRLFGGETTPVAPAIAVPVSTPLVDRAQLEAMFPGLPPPQVAEVLRQMQESAARDLAAAWPRLGEACAHRDCARLADTAHGLKGCFTMLGWARLAAFCHEVVVAARRDDFAGWTTLGVELQRLHDLSAAEMQCYLEEMTGVAPKSLPATGSDR